MDLKFIDRVGAAFGSYGWSGESPKLLMEYLTKDKIKVIEDGLKFKYMPDDKELEECIAFGENFAKMIGKEDD